MGQRKFEKRGKIKKDEREEGTMEMREKEREIERE